MPSSAKPCRTVCPAEKSLLPCISTEMPLRASARADSTNHGAPRVRPAPYDGQSRSAIGAPDGSPAALRAASTRPEISSASSPR
jgi:hypothetical protein